MDKIKLATVWLAGCSGCHMSFLDLDEWLIDLAERVDVVYSPVASDRKDYPEGVDLCLIEGAVANLDNLELLHQVRDRTRVLVSFGDCAIHANVPGMRNLWGAESTTAVLERGYLELADTTPQLPNEPGIVPPLIDRVTPIHELVAIEHYLPGCPPPADRIRSLLQALLDQQEPPHVGRNLLKFG